MNKYRPYIGNTLQYNHSTTNVPISGQMIPVDNGMVSIVQWLNSLKGVKTLFCCEGDLGRPIVEDANELLKEGKCLYASNAYVLFLCSNIKSLNKIRDTCLAVGKTSKKKDNFIQLSTEVRYSGRSGSIRYEIRTWSNSILNEFRKNVEEQFIKKEISLVELS